MQSEPQTGHVCAEYQPLSLACRVCAIGYPENQTADKQSGRVYLRLRCAKPKTRCRAGTNCRGICSKPIACPADEKICHQRARDRGTKCREEIDRVREANERRKNLRPDVADQNVERSSRRMRNSERVNSGEEFTRVPEGNPRRERRDVDDKESYKYELGRCRRSAISHRVLATQHREHDGGCAHRAPGKASHHE